MKSLTLKERIDLAKERARRLKEARERSDATRYRERKNTETEEARFRRIMNTPAAWQRIG